MTDHQSTSQADNTSSFTITLDDDEADSHLQDIATVRIKLTKPKSKKKVNWTEETVDNENMNKKKSKCCCIYQKPRAPDGSSSSDEDDECEHCHGHVEKKNKTPKDRSSSAQKEATTQSMIVA